MHVHKIKSCKGTLEKKNRSSQPRKTTEREDHQLFQMSKGDARPIVLQITFEYNKKSEEKKSDSTVKKHLPDDNLFVNGEPLISKKNWMAQVKFGKKHLHWTKQDSSKILWSDES